MDNQKIIVEKNNNGKILKNEYFRDSKSFHETNEGDFEEIHLREYETNDCVVRAFMCVLNIKYSEAHEWVKKNFDRKDLQGVYTDWFIHKVVDKTYFNYKLKMLGVSKHATYYMKIKKDNYGWPTLENEGKGYTIQTFIENFPKGRYFVIVKGHAIAIVDGVMWGNRDDQLFGLRRRIKWVVEAY